MNFGIYITLISIYISLCFISYKLGKIIDILEEFYEDEYK